VALALQWAWGMKVDRPPLKCYVAAIRNASVDAVLDEKGFSNGLITFAIPDYGVLFRCRAEGMLIDLEFGAFFALLEFIGANLGSEKIRSLNVVSSDPQFVFAFDGRSRLLAGNSERQRLLKEYSLKYKLSISYLESISNRALWPPSEYPSLRQANAVRLEKSEKDFSKQRFLPFQKGARL